jgi:putative peptidoglycan lipid II flippase
MSRRGNRPTATAVSAGAIGTSLSLLNVVVGFGFQAVLAATLGVGVLADVFQVAWTIVTFAAVVQFTMVTSLLIPRLQGVVDGVASVGRSRFPLFLGGVATLLQVAAAFAIQDHDLKVLLLAASPAHLFVGATAVPQAVAYIDRRFWIAGIGPVANGLALLAVTVVGLDRLNAPILGLAVTLGYAAQWAATAFGTRDLSSSGHRGITLPYKVFLGVLGFTLVSKFQPVLERILSYQIASGSTATLGYGQKVAQGLVLFATFGFATASTASLARHRASLDAEAAGDLLARITLATLIFGSAVCALALPAAYPAVVVLFERGAFSAGDSYSVADVVIAQIPWVWSGALTGVLTSYLYIDRRYAQVLLASVGGLATTLGCGVALRSVFPDLAVAIASSAGSLVSMLFAILILARTRIWPVYSRLVAKRRTLIGSALAMLAGSSCILLVMRLLLREPAFWDYSVAAVVTAGLVAFILFVPSKTRRELREVINAEL